MNQNEKTFVQTVWSHYSEYGRHDLLWRKTADPYRIVVSEIMLQQTQVERVIPKYKAFLKKWPSAKQLANASLGELLTAWQGLGYNRRAKMLHECVRVVTDDKKGKWPAAYNELVKLPGIGPYTAGAVMAFAYNKPVPIIETNIRTVYLHHFFKNKTDVGDKEIIQLVVRTLDQGSPREWYWALMDYGSYLKKEYGNANLISASYVRQSKFEGSDRQIRGAIIKVLSDHSQSKAKLHKNLSAFPVSRIDEQLKRLLNEQMIVKNQQVYALPN